MRTFLVAFLLCATALAGPSKSDKKLAEAHFKQGKAYFDTGQWKDAIDEYDKAWALDPEPVLQFNEALAYEKSGDVETALAKYQKYLELDPKGPVADEASEDIARIKPQVDAIVAARAKAEADAKAAADAKAKADADAKAKAAADAKAKADAAAKAKAEAWAAQQRAEQEAEDKARAEQVAARRGTIHRGKLMSWGGIGAGVIGVVGIAVGVNYGLEARAASNDLTGHTSGAWTDGLLAEQAQGRADDRNLKIFTIAGGVTAIAGAALWYVGHRTVSHGESMTLAVTASTVGVAGSF